MRKSKATSVACQEQPLASLAKALKGDKTATKAVCEALKATEGEWAAEKLRALLGATAELKAALRTQETLMSVDAYEEAIHRSVTDDFNEVEKTSYSEAAIATLRHALHVLGEPAATPREELP